MKLRTQVSYCIRENETTYVHTQVRMKPHTLGMKLDTPGMKEHTRA
jgi:hypothetical protein